MLDARQLCLRYAHPLAGPENIAAKSLMVIKGALPIGGDLPAMRSIFSIVHYSISIVSLGDNTPGPHTGDKSRLLPARQADGPSIDDPLAR